MSKPSKISEINISIFEDGRCVVKNNVIHKVEGVGTVKEIVPKKELLTFLSQMVPSVKLTSIMVDIDENSTIPTVCY